MGALIISPISSVPGSDEGDPTVTDTYRVVCEPGDTAAVAIAAVPIVLYQPHPVQVLARAKSLRTSLPGQEGWIFDLSYQYDAKPFQQGASGGQTFDQSDPTSDPSANDKSVSPELRPWVFQYGTVMVNEPQEYDWFGTPVGNTLMEPFRPTVEIERPHKAIRITAWKPLTFPALDRADLYEGAVNLNAWGRFAPNEALCTQYVTTTERIQAADFWRIEIEVVTRKQRTLSDGRVLGGWAPTWIPNRATKYMMPNPLGGALPDVGPVQALDYEGRSLKEPVYIFTDTNRLASADDILADPGPDNANIDGEGSTKLHRPFWFYGAADLSLMLA